MTEWREVTLGVFGRFHSGKAIKPGLDGLYKAFGSNGIIGGSPQARHTSGVIIGRVGAYCGSVAVAREPFWASDNTIVIEPSDDKDLDFLYYLLLNANLNQHAGGSAQPLVTQAGLKALTFRVPEPEVRSGVAAILRCLDDLIENNRRRIELLEHMAQAIYREWFVCFGYPGHEDDPLVDSPLGPISEGWRVCPLTDIADIVRGRSYRKQELLDSGGVPFVNLKCMMRGGGFRRDGLKRYDGRYTSEQQVRQGDIVLAVTDLTQGREILARATLVPQLDDEFGVISLDVVRIVPKEPEDRLPVLFALRCTDFSDRVKEFANGSTVLHLSPTHVAAADVVWPAQTLRRRFTSLVEPMLDQLDDLSVVVERLAVMRDLLLPKLVTGQIDVSSLDLGAVVESLA